MTYTSIDKAVEDMSTKLLNALAKGNRVLWLIPGGSVIHTAVAISQKLHGADLSQLHITLTDERYGPVGHKDSNWQQLSQAGFVFGNMVQHPYLKYASPEESHAYMRSELKQLLNDCTYRIGLFGMGIDGHTSGILPHSPAVESNDVLCVYESIPYIRITTTPTFIRQLDAAVLVAFGKEKWDQLNRLSKKIPIIEQPAQVLNEVQDFCIYTDYKKEL